jgi:hypothetical protein
MEPECHLPEICTSKHNRKGKARFAIDHLHSSTHNRRSRRVKAAQHAIMASPKLCELTTATIAVAGIALATLLARSSRAAVSKSGDAYNNDDQDDHYDEWQVP